MSPFRSFRLRIGRNGNALATGRVLLCALLTATAVTATSACAAAPRSVKATDPGSPLKLERKIALPDVKGRIDHLALDVEHRRLFVAEYGNGSVDEIDLESGRVVGRISGLNEPQGIAYLATQREIVVASGDGMVRFFAASDRHRVAELKLGDAAGSMSSAVQAMSRSTRGIRIARASASKPPAELARACSPPTSTSCSSPLPPEAARQRYGCSRRPAARA